MRGIANKIIVSYLSNRKQVVAINGFQSEIRPIEIGVPQGSSLGPLLFLVYINDFRLSLDGVSAGHYADDTFVIYHSKKLKIIETSIIGCP